jgi:hypothetical protein
MELMVVCRLEPTPPHRPPLALAKGVPFNLPVQPGSAIVGFFALGGVFLDAIDVYVCHII